MTRRFREFSMLKIGNEMSFKLCTRAIDDNQGRLVADSQFLKKKSLQFRLTLAILIISILLVMSSYDM